MYTLVIIDYFSKWLEAIPLPMADQEASNVSEAMVDIFVPALEFRTLLGRISFRLFLQNFADILVYSKLEHQSINPSAVAWLIYFIKQFYIISYCLIRKIRRTWFSSIEVNFHLQKCIAWNNCTDAIWDAVREKSSFTLWYFILSTEWHAFLPDDYVNNLEGYIW